MREHCSAAFVAQTEVTSRRRVLTMLDCRLSSCFWSALPIVLSSRQKRRLNAMFYVSSHANQQGSNLAISTIQCTSKDGRRRFRTVILTGR